MRKPLALAALATLYGLDKVEGVAVDRAGNLFVVTENDGVDDSSGETLFFAFGKIAR